MSRDFVRRVLVVEDEALLRALLKSTLATHGFEVDTASDAVSASRMMKAFDPDVMVVDIDLGEGALGASAEINYDLDDEIPDLLFRDRNAQVAVIEIIREVVSNAMKHSKSNKLSFKIGRYQGVSSSLGIISISAVFDGTRIDKTFPGTGMRTIGELSSHFDYHSDRKSNYFTAEVPVSAQLIDATTGT